MASAECVREVFKALCRAYSDHVHRHLSGKGAMADQVDLYSRFTKDVPDDLLKMAVADHVANSKWWPKPSEIRERCVRLIEMAGPDTNEYDAWAEVKLHMKAGHTDDPWSDPMIGRAMDGIGGLKAFGQSDVSQEMSWRSRFIDAYRLLKKRERERRLMLPEVREVIEQIKAGTVPQLEG